MVSRIFPVPDLFQLGDFGVEVGVLLLHLLHLTQDHRLDLPRKFDHFTNESMESLDEYCGNLMGIGVTHGNTVSLGISWHN